MIHLRFVATLLAALVAALAAPAALSRAQSAPTWRPTELIVPTASAVCYDPSRPGVAILRGPEGTLAFNWRTGERTVVSPLPFERCAADGTLFAPEQGGARRFSLSDPHGRTVARMPTHAADDGSRRMYSFGGGELWASEDGGVTWARRPLPAFDTPVSYAEPPQLVLSSDSRALYVLLSHEQRYTRVTEIIAMLYASRDGGATWEQRLRDGEMCPVGSSPRAGIWRAPGRPLGADHVGMTIRCGGSATALVSRDGGRSFSEAGSVRDGAPLYTVSAAAGLLRFQHGSPFARSTDGGATWVSLPNPPRLGTLSHISPLEVAPGAPNNVFAHAADGSAWHSADSGATWRRIEGQAPEALFVSPHAGPAVTTLRKGGAGGYQLWVFEP